MPSARNARTRRSHVVAAARISQRCIRTALPRRVGRIPAGFRRPSNGNTKGHESSIRRSRTLPSLCGGSQQRSGRTHTYIARIARQVRTNHAPLAAKGRPMRTPTWRFAVGHGRHQPRSLAERQQPSRSLHERLEPSAPCGRESNRERVGPTPTRHTRQRTHRFIGVKPDLAHALRSGLSASQSIRSCRACSDHTPSMGCASVGHRDSGSPINKRERNVRRTLLAAPMRLVRDGNELRPYGR